MYIVERNKLVQEDLNPDFITELSTRPVIPPLDEIYTYNGLYTNKQHTTDKLVSAYSISADTTNLYTNDTLQYSSTNYILKEQQSIERLEASSIKSVSTNYINLDFLQEQLDYIKNIFSEIYNGIFNLIVEHHASGEYVITDDITTFTGQWVEEAELEGGWKLWRKL